jgi:hypothetical protein
MWAKVWAHLPKLWRLLPLWNLDHWCQFVRQRLYVRLFRCIRKEWQRLLREVRKIRSSFWRRCNCWATCSDDRKIQRSVGISYSGMTLDLSRMKCTYVGLAKMAEAGRASRIEGLSASHQKYPFCSADKCRSWTLSVGIIFVALYQRTLAASKRQNISPSIIRSSPKSANTLWTWANEMPKSAKTSTGGKICVMGGELVKPLWLILCPACVWVDYIGRSSEFPCISNLANIIELAMAIIKWLLLLGKK